MSMNSDTPYEKPYTLWDECLFRCCDEAKTQGKDTVEFSQVDKMVIEVSKRITEWKENA